MSKHSVSPVSRKKSRVVAKTASKSSIGSEGTLWSRLRGWVWFSLAVTGLTLFSYMGYLDYTVSHRFKSLSWSLPAHVYASPVELYPGIDFSVSRFKTLLQRLHYRQDDRLATPATYYRKGSRIVLRSRDFHFWDGTEPGRILAFNFVAGQLQHIQDLERSEPVAIVRMEPVRIGEFYPSRKEDRILVRLSAVPEQVLQALFSVEDRDYYHHHGVSLHSIARAAWANFRAGRVVQGGSTITQQLVKNLYLSAQRSLWRKLNEAFMALILDARYSKAAILETYLNEIYLGQTRSGAIHGFGLASEHYFNRSVADLDLHHAALLVALIKGPSYYNPRRHPERALKRRNRVLDQMLAQAHITVKQARLAQQQPLGVVPNRKQATGRYPAFLELVRRQLGRQYADDDLTSEGLQIFTTLDLDIQQRLETTVTTTLTRLEQRKRVDALETAAIMTRREGGEVVALVGGRHANYAGFNRALDAVRPIGSLVKPMIYLTALEDAERYTLTTPIHDAPIRVRDRQGQEWAPENYDRVAHGWVPLHRALAQSYNLATVQIGLDVGLGRIARTLRQMGVTRPLDLYPSLLLGACELTPIEVATLYQTLAGDGFRTPVRAIRSVTSRDGEALQRYELSVHPVVDPAVTYLTNRLLQEVMHSGTGRSAYATLPRDLHAAGKTGTTDDLKDSWFAGFTGDYLGVVWVGRDDNKSAGLTGASGAMQVWARVMREISHQPVDLIPPDNVVLAWVDDASHLAGDASCAGMVQYPYIRGSEPKRLSPCVQEQASQPDFWQWFGQ